MILRAYGDSWTVGQGCNKIIEDSLEKDEKIEFQKTHSWVKLLGDKFGLDSVNNGVSGNSNNKIFNNLIDDIKNGVIKNDDLVIIMWSSSLRDPVPFLPSGEWVTWSVKHLIEEPHKFLNSYSSSNDKFDSFFNDFKKFFIVELFNQNYYNIVNQYYILFVQKMLNYFNIKYIMCDSFESMLIDLGEKDNYTRFIDKKYYWEFNQQTFRTFLNKIKKIDIWEYQDEKFQSRASQHPNYEGYRIISEELYDFITKNKIL